ncbi:MAG: acetylglutamate kinase [Dehalococcoidales bacterium]|nr:acetylglutamate kinase [Dehalococcoidales bacterium]
MIRLGNKLDGVIVVKLGGSTLGSHDTSILDIVDLQKQSKPVVMVHGGGKIITEWLKKQSIASNFVQGERVTDKATLEVVISVLAGLVNKELVASINNQGGRAVGISGIDGALIEGKIKNIELGYVGTVEKVNLDPLEILLQAGYIPVIAPIGLCMETGLDREPQLLNINADLVAGEIAAALGSEELVFLTDVAGICNQQGELLPQLLPEEAESLMASGVASGGMIPKIKACLRALSNASSASIIDGRQPHALLNEIKGNHTGTVIKGG